MSQSDQRDITHRIAEIRALEIPAPSSAARLGMTARREAADPGKSSAYVNRGSLIAFASGVSAGYRSAALYSTLFATMVADHRYDHNDSRQVVQWYEMYTWALDRTGWRDRSGEDAQQFRLETYWPRRSSFTISDAIVEILEWHPGWRPDGTGTAVKAALDALRKLSSDDPLYKVWDQHSHGANGGIFQIVMVAEIPGVQKTLVMQIFVFAFEATEVDASFLWTNYPSSEVKLRYGNQILVLNEYVWDRVSDQVLFKLGDNIHTQIGDLSI